MKHTRRNFLKFAGLAAAGMCLTPAADVLASGGGASKSGPMVNPGAKHAARWAMVIDTTKLNTAEQIDKLAEACHSVHNVPFIPAEEAGHDAHGEPAEGKQMSKKGLKWMWGAPYAETFPEQLNNFPAKEVTERQFAMLCNHCENPPCVRVCPTKATYQRPDGIVAMDYHRCIGCRYCMVGCPFGARSFNWSDPRDYLDLAKLNMKFPTRMRGVVEKCNFCVDRLAEGLMPACVEASNGAIVFGDLRDENSDVRKALRENFTIRRKPALGTEPGVYYII